VQGEWAALPHGRVNYLLRGPPAPAPLVVCLHGLNGSTDSFAAVEPQLRAAGLRVLLFDWYGFGLSSATRKRLNHETYVEQLVDLLDALGVGPEERLLLLGFSMGGVVAVEFAVRYPLRVERVLLVAPGGLLLKEETPCQPFVFGCLRARCGCCVLHLVACLAFCCYLPLSLFARGKRFEKAFSPDVREPERFASVRRTNSQRFAWDIRRSLTSYLRVLRSMPLWADDFRDAYRRLARGRVPVLFLWGDDDCTVPWSEVADEVVELFADRGASCIRLPGAGHGLLLEDAEEVGRYAAAWFHDLRDPDWLRLLERFRLGAPDAPEARDANPRASETAPAPEVVGCRV